MGETGNEGFDFDEWAALAREDPEGFERRREAALNAVIATASEPVRRRLVGLQWQVDRERERAGSAMGACVKLSSLMWQRVAGPDGLLESLDHLARTTAGEARARRPAASVLPFPVTDRDEPRG